MFRFNKLREKKREVMNIKLPGNRERGKQRLLHASDRKSWTVPFY